jgi:hypothetical protein
VCGDTAAARAVCDARKDGIMALELMSSPTVQERRSIDRTAGLTSSFQKRRIKRNLFHAFLGWIV